MTKIPIVTHCFIINYKFSHTVYLKFKYLKYTKYLMNFYLLSDNDIIILTLLYYY